MGTTRAAVTWSLRPHGDVTEVTLQASVLSASRADRLLLALGGRLWLQRRLAATLARLAHGFAARGAQSGGSAAGERGTHVPSLPRPRS